ncbi:cupin domain-containing protein [Catenuloplanes niger]
MQRQVRRTATVAAAVVATAVAATTLGVAGAAQATPPGPGVSGTIIAQHTVGGTDYVLRKITIPPGQATGWHYHDGTLYATVKQGALSHFDATCAQDGFYPRGSFIYEPRRRGRGPHRHQPRPGPGGPGGVVRAAHGLAAVAGRAEPGVPVRVGHGNRKNRQESTTRDPALR